MFIDEVVVLVTAGRGGDGMVSFRREKYVEFGGPSGGSGGSGGSVVFVGDRGASTLVNLKFLKHIKADSGASGKSKGMQGANALNTYIKVPLGTVCYDREKHFIGEILEHDEELVVAKGGKGGRGNVALATSKNSAPEYAEKGDYGESKEIHLELKVLADVGLVGYPSVGKSSLITALSNARPKIASYPFTTLSPNLGVVYYGDTSFVLADLPGLIANAHLGVGLGHKFLRHIERCKMLLHIIDLTSENPYSDYLKIKDELEKYNIDILKKPTIIVFNKLDLLSDQEKIQDLEKLFSGENLVFVSAYQRTNLEQLIKLIIKILSSTKVEIKLDKEEVLYQYQPKELGIRVKRENSYFLVDGSKVKEFFDRTDFNNEMAVKRFLRKLRNLNIDQLLLDSGAKTGDLVYIYSYQFEFINK